MNILTSNRKAFHNYEVLERFEAGIVLVGTEIKSLRAHKGEIAQSYIQVVEQEVFLIGSSIAPYEFGNIHNHTPDRKRKLLLHKREIEKLKKGVEQKGLTIIPLKLYLKRGKAKLEVALCKEKKKHDKRAATKERDIKRGIEQLMRKNTS